ncbi:MAG: DUF1232 domain-containing protein [Rhizobiales bacterium]|nr:DUF1232 domain-containing protein [Hyphomicrobiales bacterium]
MPVDSTRDSTDGQADEDLAVKLAEVRDGFWRKLAGIAARLPFAEDLVAAYYCTMDPRTPTRVRMTLLSALAYFILPLDTLPDFIVGLGYTDDAAVLALAMRMVSEHIRPPHREAARSALDRLARDPATPLS